MNTIEEAIDKGIADDIITKAEKKELKDLMNKALMGKHDANVLRSIVFDKASELTSATNHRAVLGWVEQLNKLILNATAEEEKGIIERCYFSPGMDCLDAILNKIKGSKSSIQCCVFTISDNRITKELIAAHKRGISVKILTDNDKMFDRGSDIEEMAAAGLKIKIDRTDNHMHHKFAIFDKKWLLTGSYNWTRSAEKYNHENILITNSKEVAKRFEKSFDELWDKMEIL